MINLAFLSDSDNIIQIHNQDVNSYSERLKQEINNFTMN